MKPIRKLILDTPLVQIHLVNGAYEVAIAMSRGGMLEHEPFGGDQRGLVAALQLAVEVNAGKFFPRGVIADDSAPALPPIRITGKGGAQ